MILSFSPFWLVVSFLVVPLVSSLATAPNGKTTTKATITTQPISLGLPVCVYHQVDIPTTAEGPPRQAVSVEDLTPTLLELLANSNMQHGTITVISRHTTTAITINERESRLAQDMADYFLKLAPPDERSESEVAQHGIRYKHNDIDHRPASEAEYKRCLDNGWDVTKPDILQAWRDQEPINAHSHLLSMLVGSSESIPVVNGKMVLGQWQSVLLVDLDGPRDRTIGIQLLGYQ
ncbi:secondary thiamine-phosphate synthase enzyme [Nitzschia inconspicua]|uniref:Secondary thiamine-phosphate synthase enzyme n=1 Tax=Nitzschia inconspicua TaxID=303405 RepID=A0A9K3PSY1_9STRA|nr:secondary thiamine-phosphate synthase enzyme [Nitzschia inconspicua]